MRVGAFGRARRAVDGAWRARGRGRALTAAAAAPWEKMRPRIAAAGSIARPAITEGALPARYEPGEVEAGWYDWWEAEGLFKPAPVRNALRRA